MIALASNSGCPTAQYAWDFSSYSYDSQSASASQVEAVAILVLTGRFLGFLPEHYAAPLVREGRLRVLYPEQIHA